MTRNIVLAAVAAVALAAGPLFVTAAEAQSTSPRCPPRAVGCNGGAPAWTMNGSTVRDQNVRRFNQNLGIGLAAGVGGLIIGSAIANARSHYQGERHYQPRSHYHGHGYRTVGAYDAHEETCFRRPIRRVDHYTGQVITVGSRLVCH